MRSHPRLRVAAAVAIAPLALVAAACSSSDSETSTGTSQAASSGTAKSSDTKMSNDTMKSDDKMTTGTAAEMDIVDTAVAAGDFTTLAKLLTDAGLVETLKGDGPFTVFAPTDDAFAKLDAATLEAVQNDPELLKRVLTYHVIAGEVMAADVKPGEVETVSGDKVTISVKDGNVYVNDAMVVTTDIETSNGVIHVIDAVLVPPTS